MKAAEVKKLSNEELVQTEAQLRKQLFELRSQAVTQKLEKPSQLGQTRKDIARVLTETRARKSNKA